MNDVYIVDAVRTPIGRRNGSLSSVHPTDLLGAVLAASTRRIGIDTASVDHVIGGCVNKVGAQSMNVTRTSWLAAGGADDVACTTVDAQCGSSQFASNVAAAMVASGQCDVVVACGVESMSLIPIGSDATAGTAAGLGKPIARSYRHRFDWTTQFDAAELIARKYSLHREEADEYGLRSQVRAANALLAGHFSAHIEPVSIEAGPDHGTRAEDRVVFHRDEALRETTIERLAALEPLVRPDGIHTAGTTSQIADGAAAVVFASPSAVESLGMTPLARILSTAVVGCDPVLMLEGPIPATRKVLAHAGLSIDDVAVTEINEAFASVVLAWGRELGADLDTVNPNGGAIALGHPLGATGCILIGKAVHELVRSSANVGLVTMCCGGGLGTATLIERCS